MKTSTRQGALITGILAWALLTAPGLRAQPKEDGKDSPAGRNRPMQSFGGGMGRYGPGYERLMTVLTDEQRASLREAMQAEREKVRELEEKNRETRKAMLELALTQKFDEEAVRQKAMAAAKIEAELSVIRFRAFSKIKPALSAEQLEKLAEGFGIEPGANQGERPRPNRPAFQRDENGLPPKDRVPANPAAPK